VGISKERPRDGRSHGGAYDWLEGDEDGQMEGTDLVSMECCEKARNGLASSKFGLKGMV